MDPSIFKAYDIRGVYPGEINEEDVEKIAKAFYTFVVEKIGGSKPPKIVLSYDGRLSSPALVEQAKKALVSSGAQIIDIGLSGTPTFYFSIYHYDYDAGIQISASHNPKEYNGVKLALRQGSQVTKLGEGTGLERIKEIVLGEKFEKLGHAGKVTHGGDVIEAQIEKALKITQSTGINDLKIVADAANATGALYLEALFKKLPCKLVKMNFEIDGNFPAHKPDPSEFETLAELGKKVVSEGADLGIAPDGDSDRVFFVDEKGEVIPASVTTALIARELLKKHPGAKIGFDVRSTLNGIHAVKENGGVPLVSRIGNPFASEIMKKEAAIFFGENSGHFIFKDTNYLEDPITVVLIFLSVISREGNPISEILKPLSVSYQSDQLNPRIGNINRVIQVLQEKYSDGKANFIDGLSIDFTDWRFNIRPSNTEPVVRLNVEALDKRLMEEKRDEIIELIKANS
ncbi:MAG: phosphomannomutase/phosphoglucomutase [Candidatus Woykebacteria bacterium]